MDDIVFIRLYIGNLSSDVLKSVAQTMPALLPQQLHHLMGQEAGEEGGVAIGVVE